MARRSKKHDDPPMAGEGGERASGNAGHNAEARAKTIRSVCKELAGLEAERASIGEQMREIKQTRIKGDLNMKIADFNAAFRLYKLEDDDRSTFLDTLRETFEALGIGMQSSFLGALDGGTPARQTGGADGGGFTDEVGFEAGRNGKKATTNPHPVGTPSHELWRSGWERGQAAIAAEMAPAG